MKRDSIRPKPARLDIGEPLYQELWRTIAASEPGRVLTSERRLAMEFGVSLGTVRRVMQRLADAGLIHKVQGKGNLVSPGGRPHDDGRGTIVFAEAALELGHPFWGPRLRGVIETAQLLHYHLQVLCIGKDHHEERARLLGTVCRPEVCGFIFPYGRHSFLKQVWAIRPRLAVVSENPCPGPEPAATVMLDLFSFGRAGVETLAQAGARRPLVVYCQPETLAGAGLVTANCQGLEVLPLPVRSDPPELVAERVASLAFDGLLFDDDVLAAKVLAALPPERRKAPVVSTANTGAPASLPPGVMRFEFDGYEAGRLLVVTLDNLIRHNYYAGTRVMLQARPAKVPGAP